MRLAAALATLAATVGFVPFLTAAQRGTVTDVCVIDDPRATDLSGLVTTASGYVAVNDSQFDSNAVRIIYLDAACKVTATVRYPTPARDPEDVAVAPDGTLWVADIGDNVTAQSRRETVALWSVPAAGAPVIHRLTYPDGPHDAEALLFGDGVPLIITKEISGTAGLYRPGAALQVDSATGVAMTRVGEFKPQPTGENNLLGAVGEVVITGAATSPDRRRVALRTYTAAYEWDVPDGDVVKAITTTTPRLTALPDEPQGEAIAYSADGESFLTISDEEGPTTIRQHAPSTVALQPAPPSLGPTSAARPTGLRAVPLWLGVAAALGGLALVGAGVIGLRRARRVPVAD
jgi:hypothetical protein